MKRLFVILSNLLVCALLVWIFTIVSDTYVSHYYPNVAVLDNTSGLQYSEVADRLMVLAEETDSLIAIQHQELDLEGKTTFSYTLFGEGSLPNGLIEKTVDDQEFTSVQANYFIFGGSLTTKRLAEEFRSMGLDRISILKPSMIQTLLAFLSRGFQLLGLLTFLLTFAALSIITQIRALKTAGIRLISGESRWLIFTRPVKEDMVSFSLGILAALVIEATATVTSAFPFPVIHMIAMGILYYNLILLGISLFFSFLFATGVKKVHLMQIIKGQLPVRGIISLILVGQLIAVVIVSLGFSRTLIYTEVWKQQETGRVAWAQEPNLVRLTTSREGLDINSFEKQLPKVRRWFLFIKEAIEKHEAVLSYHTLVEKSLQANHSPKVEIAQDYGPQGNVLLVTPSYLERQKIEVEPSIKEKVQHLEQGEFVLILPKHLEAEVGNYIKIYEEYITSLTSSNDVKQAMRATVSYLDSQHERFVYNTTPMSYQQFVTDPIIVVVTPQATGEESYSFWVDKSQDYMLFNGVENTQSLLKQHEMTHWVSDLPSGQQLHQQLLNNIRVEVWMTIAGAILGIATSILLFNTMNLLYFEEFRRDIFIKRVAGFAFLELHRSYLLSQVLVFLIGFLASLFLAQNIPVSLFVFLLFSSNSFCLLSRQMKKENKMSMTILKGA